jgi:putative intracellular protease/amidase
MKLGIPVYEGVNLLDVAGPLELFYWAGQDNDLTDVQATTQYFPKPPVMGAIPSTPPCRIKW